MFTVTLALLCRKHLHLDTPEAIAIAQSVAHGPGIPTLDNVELGSDGSVSCIVRSGAPAAADLARLLETLLPPGSRVPAPLRYAIARALGQVDAPPFESAEAFATVLARFEHGDRRDVVRRLLQRAAAAPPLAAGLRETLPAPAGLAGLDEPASVPQEEPAFAPPEEPAAGAVIFHDFQSPSGARRPFLKTVAAALALFASGAAGFTAVRLLNERPAAAASAAPSTPAPKPADPVPPAASAAIDQPPSAASPGPEVGTTGAVPATDPVIPRAPRTSPVRVIGDRDDAAFSPAFSPTGTALFFQTGGARAPSSAIAMASSPDWPGGDLRIMTIVDDGSRNYHAQPSPDGESIAFDSDRDGERGVYLADRDGSHVRRISGPGYAALPSWSPDGTRLAYIRAEVDRPSVWNLWVKPVNGGEARRITRYPYGQTWSASWFPDSVHICFTHEDTLTVLDLETGRTRQFASPVKGALVRTPAVSPDGSRIVFQVFRHGAWMLNPADGSTQCVLTDPTAEEFAWAPDGARIAFHSKRDGQWGIYMLSRG
jgi:hypothetical protein